MHVCHGPMQEQFLAFPSPHPPHSITEVTGEHLVLLLFGALS